MPGGIDESGAGAGQWLAPRRVQLARGHWRRDDPVTGARTLGWWESVTVTWPSASVPGRAVPRLQRALAAAAAAVGPAVAELALSGARHLLERQQGTRAALPAGRNLPGRRPLARAVLPPPRRAR